MSASPPEDLAPIRAQVYKDPRPETYFTRFHERTRRGEAGWAYEATRLVTGVYAWTFFRARAEGAEKVPPRGPLILAPNHFSFMDHFFMGIFLRRRVSFMAKSQLFKPPMQWIFTHGGVFPVRRGFADEEAFITSRAILERAGAIVMYCEGTRSRTGQLAELPKRGIGRLALESGAPVVPVGIHGSAHVRNWKRGQFPSVRVRYGDPIQWDKVADPTRAQQQEVANQVFERIKKIYAELAGGSA